MPLPYRDRHDAGRQLGERLFAYADPTTLVLGIPRGGVPVGYEIAHALHATLDIFLVRHLAPLLEPERVYGLVGSGGVRVLHGDPVRSLGLTQQEVDEATQRARVAIIARERTYRGETSNSDLRGRSVILADDGSATVSQLRETAELLRQHEPGRIVLAVPVLSAPVAAALTAEVDALVVTAMPDDAGRIDQWYVEYLPISHTEVRALLSLTMAEAQSRELATSL